MAMTGRDRVPSTVNAEPNPDLENLLTLARDTSRRSRASLAAALGDLFVDGERTLTERERALMTEILHKLVRDMEWRVRARLADRLAGAPQAPPELVRELARDDAEIAAPVLLHSPLLRDADLIAVVQHRTRQHQLAVAQRPDVSERVSDALVETGDADVIVTLLRNPQARISEATTAYLAEQAKRVDKLQEPLIAREELTPELARRLYWYVSAALRQRILARHPIPAAALDDALETVVGELADARGTAEAGPTPSAWVLADRIAESRGIDVALLLKTLRAGEMPLFEALFGRFTGLRPPRLQYALYDGDGRMLAVIARAMDMARTDFVPLYLLTRYDGHARQETAGNNLWGVLRLFDAVPGSAARTLLDRWRRDPAYIDAIEQIEEAQGGAPRHSDDV
jgi:uncharacterized protein (DUF2336 family)